ncbi:DUF6660 family protein [Roseivirga sp. BDSF3-8]|uniref:DUF6660 family protein n=1 Tax=Roseivirga sp. BDSF3-8 TaxID=3241598 RepID=UPI0035322900
MSNSSRPEISRLKYIALILSLYFLALAVVPCADGEETQQVLVSGEAMLDASDHEGHDHSHAEDFCTPMCGCQCCHTNVTLSFFFFTEEATPRSGKKASFYIEKRTSQHQTPLLNPPQA